jgi:hypothetical protein
MLITWTGTPLAGLLLLIVLKTGLDVWSHRREHSALSPLDVGG